MRLCPSWGGKFSSIFIWLWIVSCPHNCLVASSPLAQVTPASPAALSFLADRAIVSGRNLRPDSYLSSQLAPLPRFAPFGEDFGCSCYKGRQGVTLRGELLFCFSPPLRLPVFVCHSGRASFGRQLCFLPVGFWTQFLVLIGCS